MSLDTIYDRHIWIVFPKPLKVKDKYGNEETYEESRRYVKARRRVVNTSEDTTDRNQQTQRFEYLVPAGVKVSGNCKIIDGDLELKVKGAGREIKTQFTVHHVEFDAESIEG